MNFKNPNFNLPTKNDGDRKSPLKMRPNLPGLPVSSINSTKNYSNTFNSPQISPLDATPLSQGNTFDFRQTQPLPQSNQNPLKTAYAYQGGQQPVPQSFQSLGGNTQGLGQMPFKPAPQNGPIYNPLNDNRFGNSNPNQNSLSTLQNAPGFAPKPQMNNFENGQKESNLSTYSRGNTIKDVSKFQSNAGPANRPTDLNENLSYHSKVSTNSRNHILRAISVNNEDHLMNLNNKEDTLKNQNILIVNNFLQSVESSKRNVLRNMSENFKSRVHEIWNSYLVEQLKNSPPNLDVNSLNSDVELIKKVFLEYLLVKTDAYVEELKSSVLADIFKEIDDINNQKQYLDNRVKEIVENSYNPVKSKNTELRDKLSETKNAYKLLIEQTVQKYEKLRETHIDMYDREFAFKLNGDQNLVKNTLRNALPFLQAENKKAEDRLNMLRSKGPNTAEALQNEINFLENEIKFLQK
jgi:hypothetical protein